MERYVHAFDASISYLQKEVMEYDRPMCGRFTLTTPGEELAMHFGLDEIPDLKARYNIAPSQDIAVVRRRIDDARPGLERLVWGLVPRWSSDAKPQKALINARAETLNQKPSFHDAFHRRRCLIPADGFYEWDKTKGARRPFLFRLRDGGLFAIAGLWEPPPTGMQDAAETVALVTTQANELLRLIHDRMPVMISKEHYQRWLDPDVIDTTDLSEILRPFPSEKMTSHPVSRAVNNPRFDDPICVVPFPSTS